MKSTSGAHYIALDHVRALAAFMVVTWHFTHSIMGYPVPFEYTPNFFPLALLDEGHTGVALFMTLSGYLFAKLLDGKNIHYPAFIWNRALRLLPLLLFVVVIVGLRDYLSGKSLQTYLFNVAKGALYPTLPNGGWSITVEFHYYLILPIFLWMLRKSKFLPLCIIAVAIAARFLLWQEKGQVFETAYYSIIGRIDQFALGMIMFNFRDFFTKKHLLSISVLLCFSAFYWYFDSIGGYYRNPSYPSPNPLWIIMPTIEGLAYAVAIAWYESSFNHSTTGVSKFVSVMGEYSYSIYLLHFFFVFRVAGFVQEKIMDISNFYIAVVWSMVFFISMMPIGYLSFRFIESPFLKLRKRYIIQ